MLRPDELASIQAVVNGLLPEAVTISRGGARLRPQPTMPDGSPLRCRVGADTVETPLPGTFEFAKLRRWRVKFPDSTPVAVGDRLAVTGKGTYAVVELANPASYSTSTLAYAFRLYDTAGAPLYFAANATVTIKRGVFNPATKTTSAPSAVGVAVPVYLNDMSNELRLRGMAPDFSLLLLCDGAVDIRDGDQLGGYGPTSTSILTVQHVATHQPLGWAYKTALVTAKKPAGSST